MKKLVFCLMMLLVLAVPLFGCCGRTVALGQEFSLSVGQKVTIEGEGLSIRFDEVLEDSRCPRDVNCIWEGRVRCLLLITGDGFSESLELVQPGLTDHAVGQTYREYRFVFDVEPYPQGADVAIAADEYRLRLTVTKIQ